MNTLSLIFEQFNAQRRQVSLQGQIAIGGVAVACVAAIIGVGIWSSQPHYVSFMQAVPPQDMAQVVAKLDAAKIKYKLSFSGTDILVDKSKWNKANIAAGGLAPGNVLPGDSNRNIFEQHDEFGSRERQAKETRLAANLAQLEGIENANVHLSIADESPFAQERQASSASVILNLRRGYKLSRQKSQGIISFIASAEKSLEPGNVQLLDEKGNIYSHRANEDGSMPNDNYERQKELEAYKSHAAQTMLERMLGTGKAIVQVSAELNFEKNTQTTLTFDSDSQAIVSETIDKVTTQDPKRLPQGPAGIGANISSQAFSNKKLSSIIHETEKTDTTYENGQQTSVREFLPGEISRLTVAVTYDPWVKKKLTPTDDQSSGTQTGESSSATNTNEFDELQFKDEEIEEIVKNAVGFDADRGDEIKVIRAKLPDSEFAALLEEEPPGFLSTYGDFARHTSLGVAAILAFLFGTMTLRKLRPLTVVKESQTQITPERAQQLSAISTLAQQHPEMLGKIMAAWMNESTDAAASEKKAKRQAA